MKYTKPVCGKHYKSGTIKCSVELMPGKGGGDGTKPIVFRAQGFEKVSTRVKN